MRKSPYPKIDEIEGLKKKAKQSKYKNVEVIVDGIKFKSIWESERYKILKAAEASGKISNLRLQVRYRIEINRVKICDYIADFVYNDLTRVDIFGNAIEVVEDAKGFETPYFKLKKKLMRAVHGIDIYLSRASKSKKSKTIKSPKRQKKENGKDPQH